MESPRRNLPTAGRRYIWRLIVSTVISRQYLPSINALASL